MEIGSIFEIEPEKLFDRQVNSPAVFPFARGRSFNTAFFNTGRSAIEALLRHLKAQGKKRVWLPAFCCSSVKDAALRAGMEILLYRVEADMQILPQTVATLETWSTDVFYYVHYFGLFPSEELLSQILLLRKKDVLIFEDVTLSLFSRHETKIGFGDYILGSIRKWLALPDGAFLMSKQSLPDFSRQPAANEYAMNYLAAQLMKSCYIKNKNLDKQVFLAYSGIAMDALFGDYTVREMSQISMDLLQATDLDQVAAKREENYDLLYDMIRAIPGITPLVERQPGAVPMGMFITATDRDRLFAHLIKNGIYCNIHWKPNDMSEFSEGSRYLSEHCITIPCDQRYGKEHMLYIRNQLLSFGEM